jgi:membrane protease YdiL (CAAX protease family)
MEDKLKRHDFLFILACLIFCLLCVLFLSKYFRAASPEASIHFQVNKSQSRVVADFFLQSLPVQTQGYHHAAIFDHDDDAKTFLEKELGLDKANELLGAKVRLWYWEHRWYKALQKEEVSVRVSPAGEIIGFSHDISEEAPGPSLSADSAKTIAMNFLSRQSGIVVQNLEFLEQSAETRPHRTDHVFVWKDKTFDEKESTYRYQVDIQGDQIGSYSEYLHVPEKWTRDYEKLRAKNDTTAQVAFLFLLMTLVAMLICAIIYSRHHDIRWKTALYFGIVAALLTFLSSLNELPIVKFNYPTTESYNSFFLRTILMGFFYAVLSGFSIFLLTAAAEPLYRERYGSHISLTRLFTWSGIRTRKYFYAVIVGLTLTFAFAAYQVAFYLISKKLGSWAPQDIPYDNMLNTAIPWIYVLLIGFMPAVSEEFICRMFSISFFEKVLKIRWLAVLIPAFIWGFAHSNYPQQPFYIRGIEVSIAGLVIGWVLIKYGIFAVLVWHYTIDALYTSLLLFRSGNTYFIATAAVSGGIMLLPLLIAAGAYIKNRRFLPDDDLLNKKEQAVSVPEPEIQMAVEEIPYYRPLPKKRIAVGVFLALLLCLSLFVKREKIGGFIKFTHSSGEAAQAADRFLNNSHFDITGFDKVIYADERFNELAGKYALENGSITGFNRLFSSDCKGGRWGIRYFKPLQKEEYLVYVDPHDLSLVSFMRTVEEEAPGVTLAQDSARSIAGRFVRNQGLDIQGLVLKEASSEKRKNRTDHRFEWEAPDNDSRNIKEMKFRVRVDVQGDVVSKYTTFPKVPENWERQRSAKSVFNTLHLILRLLVIGGFCTFAIIHFIQDVKSGSVAWKKVLIITGIICLFFVIDYAGKYQLMFKNYPTAIDIQLFRVMVVIGIIVSAIVMGTAVGLALGLVTVLYPAATLLLKNAYRKQTARDTLWVTLIAVTGMAGVININHLLNSRFYHSALVQSLGMPGNMDSPVPFYSCFADMIFMTFLVATVLAVCIFAGRSILKNPLWVSCVALCILVFVPLGARTWGEALLSGVQIYFLAAWSLFVIIYLVRDNMLACLTIPFAAGGLSYAHSFFQQGQGNATWNGAGIIFLSLIVLAVLLLPGLRSRTAAIKSETNPD